MAKAVLGLLAAGVDPEEIVAVGARFGVRNRDVGWGAGLTVLTAMANVLGDLDEEDRGLALVHGLAFVARDTRGHAPRFELPALGAELPIERLAAWYRRFVETRSADAAERTLVSAVAAHDLTSVADMMFAAVTDHVFIDGGHTVDFTNKGFEAVARLGRRRRRRRSSGRSSRRRRRPAAPRSGAAWRYPHDLAAMVAEAEAALPARLAAGAAARAGRNGDGGPTRSTSLRWPGRCWPTSPRPVVAALDAAVEAGATPEELARAVAYAAALRLTRFHTQNDHADWDEVHHAFTAANALHQAIVRSPTPELLRGLYHGALRVYLDRFLNVPAARLPSEVHGRRARRPGRSGRVLGPGGHGRRGGRDRLPIRPRRRRPRRGRRRARSRAAGRGRRVPLVPDDRGSHQSAPRLAGGIRGGGPRARRRRPLPRRPHARPAASWPRWCASRLGCGGGSPCSRRPRPRALRISVAKYSE